MKLSSYAKKLGIHYNTAYRLFKRGQIPAKRKTEQVLAALQQNGSRA